MLCHGAKISSDQWGSNDCNTIIPCNVFYYRPQRSWAKVIFLQACVCPQGGRGVCLSACWDTPRTRYPPGGRSPRPGTPLAPDPPPRADTPPGTRPPRSRHSPLDQAPPRPRPPPLGSRLQHKVNERPVRILLECILIEEIYLIHDPRTEKCYASTGNWTLISHIPGKHYTTRPSRQLTVLWNSPTFGHWYSTVETKTIKMWLSLRSKLQITISL